MKKVILIVVAVIIVAAIVFVYNNPSFLPKEGMTDSGSAKECGTVSIANMDWKSAEFGANVDKFILEHGYGCSVELIPGSTEPTFSSMDSKGTPDIAPEQWVNTVREPLFKAFDEGRLVKGGLFLADGGEEGWWIPAYLKESNPELNSIEDIKKRPDLFPSKENPSKGGLYNCPAGWGCQVVTTNLFKAFGMAEAGFELIEPGSGAALAGSIAKAYERKEPWLGYYWAPTAILGKYPTLSFDWGHEHDPVSWGDCIAKTDCADPQPNSWTSSDVYTVITKRFAETYPIGLEYLKSRSLKNSDLNSVLAWMENTQAEGSDGAVYFLKNFEHIWTKWVPSDIAEKVKIAL